VSDDKPDQAGLQTANHVRDYWRSSIVSEVARLLNHTTATLEPYVVAHKHDFGRSLLNLLDELTTQEQLNGRSLAMHRECARRCEQIAVAYSFLRRIPPKKVAA
jgi:hypothetical protein